MEVLRSAPESSSFVPLAEHQSHTPESFYSGPAVLHHFSERCKVVILERELSKSTALSGLRSNATDGGATNGTSAAGDSEEDKEIVIDGVDVWVTSERLLLYSQPAKAGVAIPYPSISLHAIQRLRIPDSTSTTSVPSTGDDNTVQGLYMQIATDSNENQEDEDMEEDSTCLTIVPPARPQSQRQQQQQPQETSQNDLTTEEENKPTQTPTQDLFAAVSACSNLHPDPAALQEGDDEMDNDEALADSVLYQNGMIFPGNNAGGLPPAMPGSGGWITAENVHEYFDEDGNWKGDNDAEGEGRDEGEEEDPLGPGAGTVRPREEGGEQSNGGADSSADAEETKWRRTD
ncbi:hypothetical protein AJ79_01860 [Helicocarpus griseus UAMH5409]|uniref:Regulator of volume decrease after cellular swelling-domain-containing protein n=1 Tax=Helicocarpus griseus UAMH5409 TaxID=1447875 RepID=A0A2B7Y5Z5_9EURO|nr:hypothetical protein AJ79_01860 [Helicocarpus griseus UAMH5409]